MKKLDATRSVRKTKINGLGSAKTATKTTTVLYIDSDDESEANEYVDVVINNKPTSQRTIQVHLHSLVKNEMVEGYVTVHSS